MHTHALAHARTHAQGERVRHIALTEGVHVLMPLRASGWKRAVYQQQYRQAQQRMERARSPPPTTIALPASAAQAQVRGSL